MICLDFEIKHKQIEYNGELLDYDIYTDGRVYSRKTNKFLKPANIDNYKGGTIVYRELSDEAKEYSKILYLEGMKIKYAKRIVASKFNINEEKVRVYMRDHILKKRKDMSSTTRES